MKPEQNGWTLESKSVFCNVKVAKSWKVILISSQVLRNEPKLVLSNQKYLQVTDFVRFLEDVSKIMI